MKNENFNFKQGILNANYKNQLNPARQTKQILKTVVWFYILHKLQKL